MSFERKSLLSHNVYVHKSTSQSCGKSSAPGIGVAIILSGSLHFFLPKKLTTFFFSCRRQRPSKYTSKSNPPRKNCPKNWLLLWLGGELQFAKAMCSDNCQMHHFFQFVRLCKSTWQPHCQAAGAGWWQSPAALLEIVECQLKLVTEAAWWNCVRSGPESQQHGRSDVSSITC